MQPSDVQSVSYEYVSNGGPLNPKLTLKINSLVTLKRKAQNFASWIVLSECAFKIGRKKGNDFLIIVPL